VARKVSSLEEQLDRLAELRGQPPSPEGRAEVGKCLGSKMNLVAAKAARIAGEWLVAEVAPQLLEAFDRFMVKPEATDKRCAAKIEILKALCKLEYGSPAIFRRGLRHVQMEPTWGGSVDTAAEVRALGAMGLAQTDYPEALEEIVPLLLDPERDARIGALRAIAASGLPGGTLLLRLKALSGDEPEILGECFAGLLRAAPAPSLEFVAKFLDHREEAAAEAAALALGDSRLETGFAVLREAFERTRAQSLRRILLVAIALLRRENAIDYLLDLVRHGEGLTSADAVAALAMYEKDPTLQARLDRARQDRISRFQTPFK
jgi:HEAT repeat protein